jgi:transcriptional regulator with XRE-family HTH domain
MPRANRPEPRIVVDLRKAIQADGRSLNELEKAAGLAGGQLSRFVRGERDINFEAAGRLCDVLGIAFTVPEAKPARPTASAVAPLPTKKRAPGKK